MNKTSTEALPANDEATEATDASSEGPTGVSIGDDQNEFVVNSFLSITPCTNDEILIRRGSRSRVSRVVRDDSQRGMLSTVLGAFSTPTTPKAAAAAINTDDSETFEAIATRLVTEGVLVRPDLRVSTTLAAALSAPAQPLTEIGVIGGGLLAREVLRHLDAPGRNFHLYSGTAPGGSDVEKSLNDATCNVIDSAESVNSAVAEIFGECEFVVVCLDSFLPSLLNTINLAALDTEVPWMPTFADGDEIVIGPLIEPGLTACYTEFEIQHESARSLRTEYLLYKETLSDATERAGSISTAAAAVGGGWAAFAALQYVQTQTSFLVSNVIRVDFERLDVMRERILRLPRCPVCAMSQPDYRHPFL